MAGIPFNSSSRTREANELLPSPELAAPGRFSGTGAKASFDERDGEAGSDVPESTSKALHKEAGDRRRTLVARKSTAAVTSSRISG
jgi:hypothetical protein